MADKPDDFFTVDQSTITHGVVNAGVVGCGTVFKNYDSKPIEIKPVPTRIFGIGLHKTATSSLHEAMKILGYESWHWGPVRDLAPAHAARDIWRQMNEEGRSKIVESFYMLGDLPVPLLYEKLDKAYPGSKFILTLRDERKWLDAAMRHFSHEFNQYRGFWKACPFTNFIHKQLYGITYFDPDVFIQRYRRHNAEVLEYFKNRREDLLIMNMDLAAGWWELCHFLDCEMPYGVAYPFVNGQEEVSEAQ